MKFIIILITLQQVELPMINNSCEETFEKNIRFVKNINPSSMQPKTFVFYKDKHILGFICK
jgi:hypothetical protein